MLYRTSLLLLDQQRIRATPLTDGRADCCRPACDQNKPSLTADILFTGNIIVSNLERKQQLLLRVRLRLSFLPHVRVHEYNARY